jgi:4-hydroxy-3-polyprenylbenzoate decarboxylase
MGENVSRDLRAWLDKLETEGELLRIKAAVDLESELAEIHRRTVRQNGPALLFENIKGHRRTWCRRLFTGGLATLGRVALMLGLPKDTPQARMVALLRERFRAPVEPVMVRTGPVKQNILKGKYIDLGQLPVPLWHTMDGGRYINTWCGVVTRDPDGGRNNVGLYRASVGGPNKIHCFVNYAQHWGSLFARYQRLGKPMPVAMVYGWDPSLAFTAGLPLPVDEYRVMGAICQEPVPLVKCETSDLLVPASAEIVVEGSISTDPATFEMEGPYGEFNGYYSPSAPAPVCRVTCITYRDNPIFRGGSEESMAMMGPGVTAAMWAVLEQADIPGVLDVSALPQAVVKVHKTYQGQARQVGAALWGSRLGITMMKTVVVVDDERAVDIRDPGQVQRIVNSNVEPTRGIVVYPMQTGAPTDLALAPEAREMMANGAPTGNKLLIDATVDWVTHPRLQEFGGRRLFPECNIPSQATSDLLNRRWKEYGFPAA